MKILDGKHDAYFFEDIEAKIFMELTDQKGKEADNFKFVTLKDFKNDTITFKCTHSDTLVA